jgi:hypothetical protein
MSGLAWRTLGVLILLIPFFVAGHFGGHSAQGWLLAGQAWCALWWALAERLERRA